MPRKVFITVAERSADQHAANLVRAMREMDPDLQFHALGGDMLRHAGATVHRDTVSNAAMGLAALGRAREVKNLLNWTRDFYAREKPDLHICCDSWTMNKYFARLAKSFGTSVFYYIAPQVWASREGRVKKLREVADRVACIMPFEEPFLRERGVNATFVGHPLFDELKREGMRDEGGGMMEHTKGSILPSSFIPHPSTLIPSARPSSVIPSAAPSPVIALPCGSRRGIVKKNLPRQLAVARKIKARFPGAQFLIPATPVTQPMIERMIAGMDFVTSEVNGFDAQLPRCNLAITVSGTATLHIAAHRVPMIVVYYTSRGLWNLLGRWVVKIRTYSIVNLLANDGKDDPSKHIVPEFIPWYGPVDAVADAAIELLSHPEQLAAQKAKIASMLVTIDRPGASKNAATIAMELLNAP